MFCHYIVEIAAKSSIVSSKETCSNCVMAFSSQHPFLDWCLDYASSFKKAFFALMPYHICQNICSHWRSNCKGFSTLAILLEHVCHRLLHVLIGIWIINLRSHQINSIQSSIINQNHQISSSSCCPYHILDISGLSVTCKSRYDEE